MFLVITGNGKGKTTSAIGTAIRGLGWGKKTAIVFFDKGGSHYGEQHIFDLLQDSISVLRFGQQRFNEKTGKFRIKNTDEDRKEAKKGVAEVMMLYKQNYFLIICDELINCLNLGLVDKKSIINLIAKCPKETHLLLTGRNAPPWMIKKADLVSEVKEIKHYFKKGVKALKGIDY
jgi:cob(I)alamin adenosyltransferase